MPRAPIDVIVEGRRSGRASTPSRAQIGNGRTIAADPTRQAVMLRPGATVGPYEVLSWLGAGSMGEVYRARDTKLGRDVALKTLPEELACKPERLARLRREARTLASLPPEDQRGGRGA